MNVPSNLKNERAVELEDEIANLRAELAEANAKSDTEMERVKACEHIADGDEGWEKVRNLCPSTAAVARLRAELAAAKKKCREADERAFKRTNDANNLRRKIKDRNDYAILLHEQLGALRAAARQDAEEKARLREALILARREISDHDSDYHHRTRESTIEAIRAALACRPQGERS